MKCALPGMYGRILPIESSIMEDLYKQELSKYLPNIYETLTEKDHEEQWDLYKKKMLDDSEVFLLYENSDKEPKLISKALSPNEFEQFKQKLLKKDAEKHSQK